MASRCQVCSTNHTPRCLSTALALKWPTSALIEAVGGWGSLANTLGWETQGGLPEYVSDVRADSLACRCGLHPELVWPGWIDAGLTDRDRRFVNDGGWRQGWLHLERLREASAEVAA